MRIAVAATPSVAIPTITALLDSEDEVDFIITQPDRPAGRGRVLTQTPVAEWASQRSLPIFKPESIDRTIELLAGLDLLITIGYGVLLPQSILEIPTYGCLNLHFSLLPRWRGAAPVQRAIEAGDSVSGVTVFKLDEGMDTGPIYSMMRFALDPDITSDELFLELGELGVEAVIESVNAIKTGKSPIPQTAVGVTRAYKLSKEEGQIDWQQSAEVISQKIRAFTSVPGAWTVFRNQSVKIEKPSLTDKVLEPGSIEVLDKKLLIGTGSTALEIGHVIPAGKSRLDSAAWLNGVRLKSGEHFG